MKEIFKFIYLVLWILMFLVVNLVKETDGVFGLVCEEDDEVYFLFIYKKHQRRTVLS